MTTTPQMPKIININSSDKRAASKVKRLMENLFSQIQTVGSPFVFNKDDLINRLNELPYICLVDELTLRQTRIIMPGLKGREEESNDNFYRELNKRMKEAPLYDEEEPSDELEKKIRNKRMRELEEKKSVKLPPEYTKKVDESIYNVPPQAGEKEVKGWVIESIIDCYGIYISSLKGWLEDYLYCLTSQRNDSLDQPNNYNQQNSVINRIGKILSQIKNNDSPAVLLAPELIQTIPNMVFQSNPSLYPKLQYHKIDAQELSLKLVLLHEIGHHVFPIHKKNYNVFLSEAMANWFAYCLISPLEREFMHEKTLHQPEEYRFYKGLAFFLYPFSHGCPIPPLPWWGCCEWHQCSSTAGESVINWFEEQAFNGNLGISVKNLQSPKWLEVINKYQDIGGFLKYFSLRCHPFWEECLWHCCIRHGKLHNVQILACQLLDKAIFFDRKVKISDFIKQIDKWKINNTKRPLEFISQLEQEWYYKKLWGIAR